MEPLMANRKVQIPDDVKKAKENLKAVRLELPPDLHRALRIEAAKRDTHMSALARIAVQEFLARLSKSAK
jgi:hypothetical protein